MVNGMTPKCIVAVPVIPTIAITQINSGMAASISISFIKISSNQVPERYPASNPTVTPNNRPITTAPSPIAKEARAPHTTRLRMSRPT
ncbi:hypothetical protein D3C76_1320610 [compost metagenome]